MWEQLLPNSTAEFGSKIKFSKSCCSGNPVHPSAKTQLSHSLLETSSGMSTCNNSSLLPQLVICLEKQTKPTTQRPYTFLKSFRLFQQILQHAPWVEICLLCWRNSENGYVTCPRLQRACGSPQIFSVAFIPLSTSLTAVEKWHF